MQTEQISTTDLIPYNRNAKRHPVEQIAGLCESIRRFGFVQPIVIDAHNEIIIGHGRHLAALQLGLASVPCVRIATLTDVEIRMLRVIDNRISETGWEPDLLHDELQLLDVDFAEFNIDFSEFIDISDNETQNKQCLTLADEDKVPEVNEESIAITKFGQIWKLGEHRLMCGDATDKNHVTMLLNGEHVDMVFTDPMCNEKTQHFCNVIDYMKIKHIVVMTTFKQAISIMNHTSWSFKFDCILYFKTPSSMMNKAVPYYLHKNIVYFTATEHDKTIFNCDNAKGIFSDKGYYPSVIEAVKNTHEEHGLTKPIDAIVKILSGYQSNSIIDLFGGSGSTLIACEKINRQCFMMEIDPKYCDVIIQRWENYTGKTAALVSHDAQA